MLAVHTGHIPGAQRVSVMCLNSFYFSLSVPCSLLAPSQNPSRPGEEGGRDGGGERRGARVGSRRPPAPGVDGVTACCERVLREKHF